MKFKQSRQHNNKSQANKLALKSKILEFIDNGNKEYAEILKARYKRRYGNK